MYKSSKYYYIITSLLGKRKQINNMEMEMEMEMELELSNNNMNPSTQVVSLLAFLLSLSVLVLLKTLKISKNGKCYSHFPGPKALPLIGNLHLMVRAAAPHQMFRDLAGKYGPLVHLQLGETHFLVVSSADLAKQVMKTHDVNFANRPPGMTQAVLGYNYSNVIFAPYGEYWRQLKKICTLELLSVRRVQSFRPIREEENLNMARWVASCEGSAVNLSERLHLSSYDVVTRAVVGTKTAQRAAVTRVIEDATKTASGFLLADLYPSVKWLPFITGARFKIGWMRRELDRVFDTIIEQHRAKQVAGDEDLVDVLLKIQADDTEMSLTDDNIKAVLGWHHIDMDRFQDMFGAGTDTSATVVEWAMSEMIKSPNKLHKAQEEVRRVYDEGKMGYIDEDKFEELKYLKLVIKETLRLHPPAPLLIPKVNTERCEMEGYEIPAKSRVMVNAYALGRSAQYWDDPDKFEPERFEDSSIDFKGNHLEFTPFGAGRRMCPGMAFGLANVHFPLATLLYHFDWEMPFGVKNEDLDMTEKFGVTVNRKHHLSMIPILKRPLPLPLPA